MPSEARKDTDVPAKVGKLMSMGVLRKQSGPRESEIEKGKIETEKGKEKEKTGAVPGGQRIACSPGRGSTSSVQQQWPQWCRLELGTAERKKSDQDRKVRELVLEIKRLYEDKIKQKRETDPGEGKRKGRKEMRTEKQGKTVMMRIYCVSGVKL